MKLQTLIDIGFKISTDKDFLIRTENRVLDEYEDGTVTDREGIFYLGIIRYKKIFLIAKSYGDSYIYSLCILSHDKKKITNEIRISTDIISINNTDFIETFVKPYLEKNSKL